GEEEVSLDASNVLRVGGTSRKDDIKVELTAGGKLIRVKLGGDTILTTAIGRISEIRVWGRDGNDKIEIGDKIDLPVYVNAGAGGLGGGRSGVRQLRVGRGARRGGCRYRKGRLPRRPRRRLVHRQLQAAGQTRRRHEKGRFPLSPIESADDTWARGRPRRWC